MKTEMTRNGKTMIYLNLLTVVVLFFLFGCSKSDTVPTMQFGNVADFEGNQYRTIAIGNQVWMAENLRSEKLNNGTAIPLVTDNNTWSNITTPAYSFYSNDSVSYKSNYGVLYNWYTVQTGKLCPSGWHIPSDTEFTTLSLTLGVDSVAGGMLKFDAALWISPNTYASNSTGFTALPGGYRNYNGSYNNSAGYLAAFWSSTEYGSYARYIYLNYNSGAIGRTYTDKENGLSVRCIKD
jgi:uncharacterized protein (TIGR02145 family)